FDAVEFDPLIAAGDVLYDLAFLLMDLVERGLEPVANLVLNRYLTESRRIEDLDALAALPLFLSLRAAIRAKVTAAKLHMSETERVPAEAYAPYVTQRVYAGLAEKARRGALAGHSVIVDAVFARPAEREQIAAAACASTAPFRPLFLAAALDVRIARIRARTR